MLFYFVRVFHFTKILISFFIIKNASTSLNIPSLDSPHDAVNLAFITSLLNGTIDAPDLLASK